MMRRSMIAGSVILTSVVGAAACYAPVPPAVAPVRAPTAVRASFDRVWTTVIDVFAEQTISIRTIDKASGFIVAAPAAAPTNGRISGDTMDPNADCGRNELGKFDYPSGVTYNVRVRPEGTGSIVIVTATFSSQFSRTVCVTRGTWESAFEAVIKRRAEAP